mgnify:CR=1 FL=1
MLSSQRLKVLKTYKIFVDGKFPRTESGRYFVFKSEEGEEIANICHCSRKDFRDAVSAARNSWPKWSTSTHYNRGQILYRIAEMLEGLRDQFITVLMQQGSSEQSARAEVDLSIDRLIYYAGWADKYQQIFSSVNPVASSHFNFSALESGGVVAILAPEESALLGLISVMAPALVGGNSIVLLASGSKPLSAVTFGEVLNTSDVPSGVVNILTGYRKELLTHFSSHMDVNSVVYCGSSQEELKVIQENAALNVKRVIHWPVQDWTLDQAQGPYSIFDLQEIKTTWHPIGC